jgi:Fe-S-cluster containining protein
MSNCSVVTNGCNGKCCEAVFFPYTVEEIKRIKQAKESETSWTDDKGREHVNIYPKDSLVSYDYLIDMIIPLGYSIKDPETGRTFRQCEEESGKWEGQEITDEKLSHGKRLRSDGEIEGYIITCKHFDTENRICNDYENRPGLCRKFGETCKYEGCKCASKMLNEKGEANV